MTNMSGESERIPTGVFSVSGKPDSTPYNPQISLLTENRWLMETDWWPPMTDTFMADGYLNKMLHFPPIYFFFAAVGQKNASEPLQLLGYIPIIAVHQMLHWCNIFKENSHATVSEKLTAKSKRNYNPEDDKIVEDTRKDKRLRF